MDLCPAAEWTVTEIRHRRPNEWVAHVDRLYELLEEHGERALRDAFVTAAKQRASGAEYVEAILSGHVVSATVEVLS